MTRKNPTTGKRPSIRFTARTREQVDPMREMHQRELHHFETEQEVERLRQELARMTRMRDGYRDVVLAVQEARSNHPKCERVADDDVVKCGWKQTVLEIDSALSRFRSAPMAPVPSAKENGWTGEKVMDAIEEPQRNACTCREALGSHAVNCPAFEKAHAPSTGEHFHIWSDLPCKPGQCRMDPHAPTCAPMCDRPCSPACVERHAPTDDEREALLKELAAWRRHTGDTALANLLGRAASALAAMTAAKEAPPNHCLECGAWGTIEIHLPGCSRRTVQAERPSFDAFGEPRNRAAQKLQAQGDSSDDERKWLDSFRRWNLEDVQNSPRTALGAIQRLVAHIDSRRTVQGEPTAHDRDRDGICRRCGHGITAAEVLDGEAPCMPQGEPSDAAVHAAGAVLYVNWEHFDFDDPDDWESAAYGLVLEALRAAAEAEGGNR